MKKLMILIFLLFIPVAFAMYGGESYTKTFDECDNIIIFIEGNRTIDNNEFTINDECIEVNDSFYNCNCTNGWVFNFTTKLNTINDYNITFNYDYTKNEVSNNNGGSSGGSNRKDEVLNGTDVTLCNSTNWNCTEWKEVNGNKVRDCYNDCGTYLLDILSKPIVYEAPRVEEVKPIINKEETKPIIVEPKEDSNVLLIVVLSFLFLIGFVYFIIWKFT